jgi:hypothetical protein
MRGREVGAKPITLQTVSFCVFGFTLAIHTNSQHIIEAATTSFGPFGVIENPITPDFVFRLWKQPQDSGQITLPQFHTEGDLACQTMGQDASITANLKTGVVEGSFSPTVLAAQPFFRFHFLEFAFFVMLSRRGIMGVHGAAVVKQGRAVLLRAQSGGGKTTLAYAAARRTCQALAEDVVWIDLKRGWWWGRPWSFHLLPDAKTLFPELIPYQPVVQTNGEVKLEVDLETIRSGSTITRAEPGPVVLVERLPGGRSRLEPLTLAESKPQWAVGWAGNERTFPNYDHHIEALLRHNAYRLYFGDDIEGGVALLESLFE